MESSIDLPTTLRFLLLAPQRLYHVSVDSSRFYSTFPIKLAPERLYHVSVDRSGFWGLAA